VFNVPSDLLIELPPPPSGKTGWPWTETSTHFIESIMSNKSCPRISIITPSYNQGIYLEATVRSVLLQKYPELEFIIIDGGSTDNSVDIIRKYERWIKYWVSEPDDGQAYAIDKGIRKATGDILAWLNSDDVLCPGALHKVAEQYVRMPEVDLVYGDCDMIDQSGNVFSRFNVRAGGIIELLEENFISQPSAFFSRRALEKTGGLDRGLNYAMDYDLWIRIFLKKMHVYYLPITLSQFRYHDTSKSGLKSVRFGYECLDLLNKIDKSKDETLLPMLLQAYFRTFGTIIYLYRQTVFDNQVLADAIAKLLERWILHLEQFSSYYFSLPELLARSYFVIGNNYCLINKMEKGRRYFAEAFRTNNKFNSREFLAWIATFFGSSPFKWYYQKYN
jgi:glycosyltransferase involved in cell wall biosynthesis